MAEEQNEFWKQWSQVVARAWSDEGFKRRLLAEPEAVLKEQGVTIPAGVQLRVVEEATGQLTLVLPAKPSDQELSEDNLSKVAAGGCRSRGSCVHCRV